MKSLAVVIAVAVTTLGCSKSKHSPPPSDSCVVTGSAAVTAGCDFTADGLCDELTGTLTNCERASFSAACAGGGGTYAESACSTAGTVAGHCHYAVPGALTGVPIAAPGATVDEYYDTSGWTLSTAQLLCAESPAGVWQ